MVQGTLIGVIGIALGVVGGVLLAHNVEAIVQCMESACSASSSAAADVYYISDLPSDLHWSDVAGSRCCVRCSGLLATLYPAWRAARTAAGRGAAL